VLYSHYTPYCKDEFVRLLDFCIAETRVHEPNTNLLETKTLCSCLFAAIVDLLQSAYATLELRSYVSYGVLNRSIIEYIVDLRFLAISNSVSCNRRFVNYHKLVIYWNAPFIEHFKDRIPAAQDEYREYVINEFSEIIEKLNPKQGGSVLEWSSVDKAIKQRFHSHGWSGLSLPDRIKMIKSHLGDWDFLCAAETVFRLYSNFIHPTTYGGVPNFSPSDKSFSLSEEANDASLKHEEQALSLLLSSALEAFCDCLDTDHREDLLQRFRDLFGNQPKLTAWLFERD